MKIAVIGATGLVGKQMIKVLQERGFDDKEFILAASSRSTGINIRLGNCDTKVVSLDEAVDSRPEIALFSAGSEVSKDWAPRFEANDTYVIDNSSAWRMEEGIPLIVPEINGHVLDGRQKIIANPNCSTIQMVMALAPLHRKYRIKRVVVSTYQSVTGSGGKGQRQLETERNGEQGDQFFPHTIDLNIIPEAGSFTESGYTTEENKLVDETRKILGDNSVNITATAVRVPVYGGHSESVNIELQNQFIIEEVMNLLSTYPGIIVEDDPANHIYPMPSKAQGNDNVFVGRIRRDYSVEQGLNLWVVSDNLRKGAATNAVQIAEYLINNKLIR